MTKAFWSDRYNGNSCGYSLLLLGCHCGILINKTLQLNTMFIFKCDIHVMITFLQHCHYLLKKSSSENVEMVYKLSAIIWVLLFSYRWKLVFEDICQRWSKQTTTLTPFFTNWGRFRYWTQCNSLLKLRSHRLNNLRADVFRFFLFRRETDQPSTLW